MEPITQNTKNQISDLQKEKISLIEDIFKVKRLLYGFGLNHHLNIITSPEEVFDYLYELSIPSLELKLAILSATASAQARLIADTYKTDDDDA